MPGDAFFPSVQLLIQDGASGRLHDYGPNDLTVMTDGSPTVGINGIDLDGISDDLYIAGGMPAGTDPIVVEIITRLESSNGSGTHTIWNNSGDVGTGDLLELFADAGALKMRTGATVTTVLNSTDFGALLGTFHEYAFERDASNVAHFWVDGDHKTSWADATDYHACTDLLIGAAWAGGGNSAMRFDQMRTTYAERYTGTGDYTPVAWDAFYKTVGGTVTGVDDGEVVNPNSVKWMVFRADQLTGYTSGPITPVAAGTSNAGGVWSANVLTAEEHVVMFFDRRDEFNPGPDYYNHRFLRFLPGGGSP